MSQSLFWPAGESALVPGQLVEESKVSQSWCWHAGGWGQGPGAPGADVGLMVGGNGTQGRLRASADSLVGRAGSLGLWLQGPGSPEAGAIPLVVVLDLRATG